MQSDPAIVHVDQLSVTLPHKAVTEASTIGLKPGTFPREIIVQDDEGRSVILERWNTVRNADEKMLAVCYRDRSLRCLLTVYND